MPGQTVFVQFRYCPLCRLNHKKGKKHVHSKRHQDIVSSILAKFLKKISEATEILKKPSVKDLTWDQAHIKFWCYFCQEDIKKHRHNTTPFGDCVLEYGGLLEHITRSDHVEHTAKFLKENKLDMKRTTEFIISSKVYLKYLEDIESACLQFFLQKSQALNQIASQIKLQSVIGHEVVATSTREQNLLQQNRNQQPHLVSRGGSKQSKSVKNFLSTEERGKKTIQAFGEGLTAVERHDEDDSVGNIYTNAIPPWMQPEQDTEASTRVVGPTMEDLEKQKKLEKKRQLPACRVGAKFDRKAEQTELWLPEFGGVWSHGRRTKSAQQFVRRQSRKIFGSSTSGLSYPHAASSFQTSSYSFPKLAKITATITRSSNTLTDNNHGPSVVESSGVQTGTQSSSNSVSLSASSISHNSDFFYNRDLEAARSYSSTQVGEVGNSECSSSPSVSGFVNTESFVTVKPYVRKYRTTSAIVSEQGIPSALSHIPFSHPSAELGTMNKERIQFGVNSFTRREELPQSNMISENYFSSTGHNGNLNSNGATYQKYTRHGHKPAVQSRELDLTSNNSFRLIATPILNQQKNSLPSKKKPFDK